MTENINKDTISINSITKTKYVKNKNKKQDKKFRLSCKHLFLTYSRCPIELQDLYYQITPMSNYLVHILKRKL